MNQPFDLNTLPVLRTASNRYVRVTGFSWGESKPAAVPTVKFCHLYGDDQDKEHELELSTFLDAYAIAAAIQPFFAKGQVYLVTGSDEFPDRRVEIVSVTPDDDFSYVLVLRDCETGRSWVDDATDFQKAEPVLVQIH